MHACMHTYRQTDRQTHRHRHTHTDIHTYIRTYVRAYVRAYVRTYIHRYIGEKHTENTKNTIVYAYVCGRGLLGLFHFCVLFPFLAGRSQWSWAPGGYGKEHVHWIMWLREPISARSRKHSGIAKGRKGCSKGPKVIARVNQHACMFVYL